MSSEPSDYWDTEVEPSTDCQNRESYSSDPYDIWTPPAPPYSPITPPSSPKAAEADDDQAQYDPFLSCPYAGSDEEAETQAEQLDQTDGNENYLGWVEESQAEEEYQPYEDQDYDQYNNEFMTQAELEKEVDDFYGTDSEP